MDPASLIDYLIQYWQHDFICCLELIARTVDIVGIYRRIILVYISGLPLMWALCSLFIQHFKWLFGVCPLFKQHLEDLSDVRFLDLAIELKNRPCLAPSLKECARYPLPFFSVWIPFASDGFCNSLSFPFPLSSYSFYIFGFNKSSWHGPIHPVLSGFSNMYAVSTKLW